MPDDALIPIEEDEGTKPDEAHLPTWQVLVVDDDLDVHRATDLALRDLVVEGGRIELLFATSASQALQLLTANEDVAVILLDVVMESPDAGLRLVRHIRHELGRAQVRIILRTGQPGYAPELETVRDYDINDYKTKSELTRIKLFTALTTAVRAYRQVRQHEALLKGFERLIQASTQLSKTHDRHVFARMVLQQLARLAGPPSHALVCVSEVIDVGRPGLRVLAATGPWAACVGWDLQTSEMSQEVIDAINEGMASGVARYDSKIVMPIRGGAQGQWLVYAHLPHALSSAERELLGIYAALLKGGVDNVQLYARLRDRAYLDPLLDIPNLNSLLNLLDEGLWHDENSTLALIDIDDFSHFVDTLGHDLGDELLLAVARRLQSHFPYCHVARLGPDVFGVLGASSQVFPGALQNCMSAEFHTPTESLRVTATIGLVTLEGRLSDGAALLKDAHVALKAAKKNQRGSVAYFSEGLGFEARERMRLLANLRVAFEAQNMYVQYQPKVSMRDGCAVGLEALLRWRLDDGQMVSPDRFIPLAEQSGLMVALGDFVLRCACRQLVRLREAGEASLVMAVNVSQAQLRDARFVKRLQRTLLDTGVPPSQLEIEVTESMAADDTKEIAAVLDRVRALGVSVAIDDFGTGFSSLGTLRDLTAQRLKIDRSFVDEIADDDSIARMVINLGRSMGMQITAEGVETEAQQRVLRELGCDEGQGWLYAPALDEEALLGWLAKRRATHPCVPTHQ